MSEPKPPIVALQEAAEALRREANGIAAFQGTRRVEHVESLHRVACALGQVADDLAWIGYRWIPEPLKRTAAALAKLTPADVKDDARALMKTTAAALEVAAEALGKAGAASAHPEALDAIGDHFTKRMGYPVGEPMGYITQSLKRTADALRIPVVDGEPYIAESISAIDRSALPCLHGITCAVKQYKEQVESDGKAPSEG